MSNQQIIYLSGKLAPATTEGVVLDSFFVDKSYIVIDNINSLNSLLEIYNDRALTALVYCIDEEKTYLYKDGVASPYPELYNLIQKGIAFPTTEVSLGTIFINTLTGEVYRCTGIEDSSDDSDISYQWTPLQSQINAINKLDADFIKDGVDNKAFTKEERAQITTNTQDISTINGKIPQDASSENQLAPKDFVLDAVNSVAAYYITKNAQGDPFDTEAQLRTSTTVYSGGVQRTPTRNDYSIVIADESHPQYIEGIQSIYSQWTTTDEYIGYYIDYSSTKVEVTSINKDSLGIIPGTTIPYTKSIPTTRYTYQGVWEIDGTSGWQYQWVISSSSFTKAQLDALNSTITRDKVDSYDAHISNKNNPHQVTKSQVGLSNVDNTSDLDKPISTATQNALNGKVDKTTEIAGLQINSGITSNDLFNQLFIVSVVAVDD